MARTKLIDTEVGLAVTSTLNNATVIRVYNSDTSAQTVSIAKSTATGYANTATATLPAGTVEFFEKAGADKIWSSDNAVLGSKVGFTA